MRSGATMTTTVQSMKCDSYAAARALALPVFNAERVQIGELVPVGRWMLDDHDKIAAMASWRQRAMRMFLTQFNSTAEGTANYLRKLAVPEPDRLLFLLLDEEQRFVGHLGLAAVGDGSAELDNLMRGVGGSDPRLVYFAELALLDWAFSTLGVTRSAVQVLSYNWMVLALHEEVGYVVAEQLPLFKSEQDGVITHRTVAAADSNVRYTDTRMLLSRQALYARAPWLAGAQER